MGRKTSVWLPDGLAERVRVSGVPLAELVRRGLDAGEPPPFEAVVRGAVEAAMREVVVPAIRAEAEGDSGVRVPVAASAWPVPRPLRCPHPGTRSAGGFCRVCDARVEPGGLLPAGWVKPEGRTA